MMSDVQDYHERIGSRHDAFQAMVVSSELWSVSTASMLKIKLHAIVVLTACADMISRPQ